MAVAALPLASVAVNVTVVKPSSNVAGASLTSSGAVSTRSAALTPARNAAIAASVAATGAVDLTAMSAGGVTTGGVRSSTVT